MNGGPSWCVPDDGAGPHSPIDANISWGDLDGTVDAWSAVEAVKGERCGDFAIEDLSPGPLRKSSWRDAVEVEYYDDGSTNLDSLDASPRKRRRAAHSPAATHPSEPLHPSTQHPAVHPTVLSSDQPPSSATSPAEMAHQIAANIGHQVEQALVGVLSECRMGGDIIHPPVHPHTSRSTHPRIVPSSTHRGPPPVRKNGGQAVREQFEEAARIRLAGISWTSKSDAAVAVREVGGPFHAPAIHPSIQPASHPDIPPCIHPSNQVRGSMHPSAVDLRLVHCSSCRAHARRAEEPRVGDRRLVDPRMHPCIRPVSHSSIQ